MKQSVNKTMDRNDLLDRSAQSTVEDINRVMQEIYRKGMVMTSWYGTLEKPYSEVGLDNRGADYQPLPGAVDDNRIPWFLYWEIEWVIRNGPELGKGMKVLDAGGTSSLFSCYLASLGLEVHSIDINPSLLQNSNDISRAMGWKLRAYAMDIEKMEFEDMFFDHAFSISVFEHLDYYTKQKALLDIHRCLKPGGRLCMTFDYANPAPFVFGCNRFDTRPRNALGSPEQVKKVLCPAGLFEMLGNRDFMDNGKRYLEPPRDASLENPQEYTFGALFTKKKELF
ncbi:MAG TPA: class I SAM-dependent methyltransferase [Thermodesulfobacteriaceae bacterium]|nr:class I SAM-dependent methyltransferase [Thermodesulfobacteriaceae bacterium]